MYNRLRRTKYGKSPAFTVAVFIEKHPLQLNRRSTRLVSSVTGSYREIAPGFIVCGPQTKELVRQVGVIALTDESVIIQGETGVGKEGVADLLHQLSPRHTSPLIKENCANLVDNVVAHLFGHERGAYTGANTSRSGLFGLADGGTLYLNEFEELDLKVQAMLLCAMETGEIRPMGSSTIKKTNARFIVATNKSLQELIANKSLRPDLRYRFVHVLTIPPLRKRPEEIPVLAQYFVHKFGKGMRGIEAQAMELLVRYAWPGNIRELINVIKQALVVEGSGLILAHHLPFELHEPVAGEGKVIYLDKVHSK